ncbi:MAG: class I SAM-dependent methyltransferase [Ignavibacteriales bacterium]|nr:class I SAM-dependent methyltransferase [Ignavibacteriales bacterium]
MNFSTFFSLVQEAPWYRQFLNPVIDEINKEADLLDIGTGTGKLLQILSEENKVNCYGTDTSSSMLEEAKKKLRNTNVKLQKLEANERLPFENNRFEFITICNVLFNLTQNSIDHILMEALRVLKRGGKIIVLTPTGKGNIITLTKRYLSIKNLGIYIWFYATKRRADLWTKDKYLLEFSKQNLTYKHKNILNGFAQVEVLEKI